MTSTAVRPSAVRRLLPADPLLRRLALAGVLTLAGAALPRATRGAAR
ncbi:hypothetical protein ACIOJE_10015 [Kitasatospora sp. NPDC087861]